MSFRADRSPGPRGVGGARPRASLDRGARTRGTKPLIVDAHNDLLTELAKRRDEKNPFATHWLRRLLAGGVGLQICPISIDLDREPRAPLYALLEQVTAWSRAIRENDKIVCAIRTRSDLTRLSDGSRLGLMLAIEDCSPFGRDIDWVEVFWELGVRMVSLTWNRRNSFADGGAEPADGGLSRRGGALVDRLVEAGMRHRPCTCIRADVLRCPRARSGCLRRGLTRRLPRSPQREP